MESYLQSLTSESPKDNFDISPFVKSMATGKDVPTELNYKKEFLEYLLKNHK
ncbi:hypothetical protein [Gelidibacter japonicus]|uniref:hypothetical protein n=1 Tax=Gelidibacter japonicus TaxID=1962232 RepID=UPI001F08086F|nr:hypothetical protein [Gelidibacter japonicus]